MVSQYVSQARNERCLSLTHSHARAAYVPVACYARVCSLSQASTRPRSSPTSFGFNVKLAASESNVVGSIPDSPEEDAETGVEQGWHVSDVSRAEASLQKEFTKSSARVRSLVAQCCMNLRCGFGGKCGPPLPSWRYRALPRMSAGACHATVSNVDLLSVKSGR